MGLLNLGAATCIALVSIKYGYDLMPIIASNIGNKIGEVFFDGFKGTVDGMDVDKIFNATATKLTQSVNTAVQEAINNFDAVKISEQLGKKFTDFSAFFDVFDSSKFTRKISEEFQQAIGGIDINAAKEAGEKAAQAFHDSFRPTIDAMKEEFKDASEEITDIMNDSIGSIARTYIAYGIAGTLLTGVAYYGIKYAYDVAVYNMSKPTLAREVKYNSLKEKIGSYWNAIWSGSEKFKAPVLSETIRRKADEIIQATKNIQKNSGYLQNVLLHGPGGTGKTMLARQIAYESGLQYMMMTGGDLAQFIKRGEHVTELNKLIDAAESSNGTVLFIDEAEALCRDRGLMNRAEELELLDAFLNRTGTESKKLMVVLSTNRRQDLDPAILDRMDHKIQILPPGKEQRTQMLTNLVFDFFTSEERSDFFSEAKIMLMAEKTEGFTGRRLSKFINVISGKKSTTFDNKLTQKIIDQTMDDFVLQEMEEDRLSKQVFIKA